ncbi:hypothetical protein HAX54_008905 [Datura stramonium]|uniref:Uncharacterized protein n=1 Tax=Datura stramonium TaxID=4076 RepID=A0ABS8TFM8_DATST|nr:hypothetical protein [Datura stramonium]
MVSAHENNEDVLENQCINIVREQAIDIRNRPIVDNDEEIDLEAMDLTNVNTQRVVSDRAYEKAVHWTNFDDIKEALEILTAQHRSMIEHITTQDDKVMKLLKTLTTMTSNDAEIGG